MMTLTAIPHHSVAESSIAGMPETRLEFHFDNWRRWMKNDVIGDGYPTYAAGFVHGGNSMTFDEMMDSSDIRCARAVDALMRGLTPAERCAINHNYLRAVFRFPRDNLPELLRSARFRIACGLVARAIY